MAPVPLTTPRRVAVVAALLAIGAGCGAPATPEDEVRALVQQAEEAAEDRDAARLADLVDPDYRDAQGYGAEELGRMLRGWFIAHQSVRLVTRVESVEFPADDVARLSVTVGMLGREAGADAWDLAVDVYDIELMLAREDGEWRVTRAAWSRGAGG